MYAVIIGLFCGCLIVSNIIAAKTFTIGYIILPCSIILFPLVYIVGDILAEIYGFNLARRTIVLGLIANLVAVIAFQLTILMPGSNAEIANGFEVVLATTPRILLACICSYFTGSYVNAYVMHVMKRKFSDYLFARCITSTLFGETVDSVIFITICFAGTEPASVLLTMIACQVTFKVVYEIIAYPLTKAVINRMRRLEESPLLIK